MPIRDSPNDQGSTKQNFLVPDNSDDVNPSQLKQNHLEEGENRDEINQDPPKDDKGGENSDKQINQDPPKDDKGGENRDEINQDPPKDDKGGENSDEQINQDPPKDDQEGENSDEQINQDPPKDDKGGENRDEINQDPPKDDQGGENRDEINQDPPKDDKGDETTGTQYSSNTNTVASNNTVQAQISPALNRSDVNSPRNIRRMQSKKNIEELTKLAKEKLESKKKQPQHEKEEQTNLAHVKEVIYKNRVSILYAIGFLILAISMNSIVSKPTKIILTESLENQQLFHSYPVNSDDFEIFSLLASRSEKTSTMFWLRICSYFRNSQLIVFHTGKLHRNPFSESSDQLFHSMISTYGSPAHIILYNGDCFDFKRMEPNIDQDACEINREYGFEQYASKFKLSLKTQTKFYDMKSICDKKSSTKLIESIFAQAEDDAQYFYVIFLLFIGIYSIFGYMIFKKKLTAEIISTTFCCTTVITLVIFIVLFSYSPTYSTTNTLDSLCVKEWNAPIENNTETEMISTRTNGDTKINYDKLPSKQYEIEGANINFLFLAPNYEIWKLQKSNLWTTDYINELKQSNVKANAYYYFDSEKTLLSYLKSIVNPDSHIPLVIFFAGEQHEYFNFMITLEKDYFDYFFSLKFVVILGDNQYTPFNTKKQIDYLDFSNFKTTDMIDFNLNTIKSKITEKLKNIWDKRFIDSPYVKNTLAELFPNESNVKVATVGEEGAGKSTLLQHLLWTCGEDGSYFETADGADSFTRNALGKNVTNGLTIFDTKGFTSLSEEKEIIESGRFFVPLENNNWFFNSYEEITTLIFVCRYTEDPTSISSISEYLTNLRKVNYPVVVITHINDKSEKEQQKFLQSVGAGNNAILFNGETIFDHFYYPDSLYVDLLKKIRDSRIKNVMLVRSEGYSFGII